MGPRIIDPTFFSFFFKPQVTVFSTTGERDGPTHATHRPTDTTPRRTRAATCKEDKQGTSMGGRGCRGKRYIEAGRGVEYPQYAERRHPSHAAHMAAPRCPPAPAAAPSPAHTPAPPGINSDCSSEKEKGRWFMTGVPCQTSGLFEPVRKSGDLPFSTPFLTSTSPLTSDGKDDPPHEPRGSLCGGLLGDDELEDEGGVWP